MELTFNKIAMKLNIAVDVSTAEYPLNPSLVHGPKRELRKLEDHMELFILGLILDSTSLSE